MNHTGWPRLDRKLSQGLGEGSKGFLSMPSWLLGLCFILVLGVEPKALRLKGKCSTTERHSGAGAIG